MADLPPWWVFWDGPSLLEALDILTEIRLQLESGRSPAPVSMFSRFADRFASEPEVAAPAVWLQLGHCVIPSNSWPGARSMEVRRKVIRALEHAHLIGPVREDVDENGVPVQFLIDANLDRVRSLCNELSRSGLRLGYKVRARRRDSEQVSQPLPMRRSTAAWITGLIAFALVVTIGVVLNWWPRLFGLVRGH